MSAPDTGDLRSDDWVIREMQRIGVSDFRTDIQLDGSTVCSGIASDDYPFQFTMTAAEMAKYPAETLADHFVERMRAALTEEHPDA